MSVRTLAVGCPRWPIVSADLPPDAPAAVFVANRVVSSSPAALAFGIRRGMRRREAQARCPEVEVLVNDPARDARAFEKVVAVVESFSPRVEVVRPGLCVLAARGPARYFGGEEALRERVADAVDDTIDLFRTHRMHLDDRARTGIADGPFAATLAATRGVVVPPGASPSFLAPFAIRVLGQMSGDHLKRGGSGGRSAPGQPDLCDLFFRLGLRTLGDLAALEAGRVTARFGVDGEIAHRLARGADDRLLEPRAVPPDLTVVRELDPPAHRVDVAMFAGKAAADELAQRLGELGLACAKLAITATTEHGEERTRVWRYSAAFTPAAIAERVRWQLEGWLQTDGALTGGVSILRLVPEDVGPANGSAVGFWGRRGDVSDRVRRAIGRIQGLLGQSGAQQPTLQGGRHPSEQVHLVAWGDPVERARPGLPGAKKVQGPVEVELPPWPGRLPPPAPSVVYAQPRPVEVLASDGSIVGVSGRFAATSVPSRVRFNGRGTWTDVVSWTGPWPVDEKWWDETAHRRRARFQIALADGTAHLLTIEDGDWLLEATYD